MRHLNDKTQGRKPHLPHIFRFLLRVPLRLSPSRSYGRQRGFGGALERRQFTRPGKSSSRLLMPLKEGVREPVVLIKEIRNRFSFRIKIDRTIKDRTDHEEFEERRRQKIAHFFRGCPKPLACAHFLPTDVEEFIRNIKRIRIPEDFLADSRADLPRSSCS